MDTVGFLIKEMKKILQETEEWAEKFDRGERGSVYFGVIIRRRMQEIRSLAKEIRGLVQGVKRYRKMT
jgi:uncharacterized coiled-coil DUF342 family protein